MNDLEPTRPPLAVEIHPVIAERLDSLERAQKEQAIEIQHWQGMTKDAAAVAIDVQKHMKDIPGRRGSVVRNVMAIGGLASLSVGCWWVLPAASLIVTGSIMLGLVVIGTMARHKSEREHVRSDS